MEKPNERRPSTKIQWHPAFCAAAELELRFNKDDLEFKREYNLSKKPLQMDLLIIEKRKGVQIQNEIGKIFRGHNIIEYKSPDDGMTIDDFFKTLGYAFLYKGLGEKVNQIPLRELTVSLFRASAPKELLNQIPKEGYIIERQSPGIYLSLIHISSAISLAKSSITGIVRSARMMPPIPSVSAIVCLSPNFFGISKSMIVHGS